MPYGGTLAMTRLLAFTGLLLARDIGGRSVYLIPPGRKRPVVRYCSNFIFCITIYSPLIRQSSDTCQVV